MTERRSLLFVAAATVAFVLSPTALAAQGRGNGGGDRTPVVVAEVSFGAEMTGEIRGYYDAHPRTDVESLPPGIRRNLARGKPLPPGIAKKAAPPALVSGLSVPAGYEVIEVGWDVLLVDAATSIIHDVLTDVIR